MPTKTDCTHYNWGGDLDNPDRPTYPREYGARCEKYDTFFLNEGSNKHPKLSPNCKICEYFERKPEKREENMCDNCETPCKCKKTAAKDKPIREVAGDEEAADKKLES